MSASIYPAQLSGIQETITDAKGDIIAATAANTVARLAVGADGTVLTAASGQATGLQWAAPSTPALTRISASSFGNVSSVDLLSVFSATYVSYLVVFSGLQRINASGSTTLNASFYTGTNTAYTDGSSGGVLSISSAGAAATGFGNYSSATVQFSNINEDGARRNTGTWFVTPNSGGLTAITHMRAQQTGNTWIGGFNTTNNSAITGFKIFPSSGNMDGLITVYGLANS